MRASRSIERATSTRRLASRTLGFAVIALSCSSVRIATFNINGINARLENLLEYLARDRPDVVCLQELKATDAQFPAAAIEAAGYYALWSGQRLWNRRRDPVARRAAGRDAAPAARDGGR